MVVGRRRQFEPNHHGHPAIDHIPAPHVLGAFLLRPALSITAALKVTPGYSYSLSVLSRASRGPNSGSMHLRSLALVWAVLLVRINAVFQNVSFGPSSPQVQLLPSNAWTFVKPENTNIPQYAFTDVEGAQAVFTFPRACRVGQHAPAYRPPERADAYSNHVYRSRNQLLLERISFRNREMGTLHRL